MSTVKRNVHEKEGGERAGVVDLTVVLLKSYSTWYARSPIPGEYSYLCTLGGPINVDILPNG
jgi:hypothetical protein